MSAPHSVAVPLPPAPPVDPFTPKQWAILGAIADTVVPKLSSSTGSRLLQHPLRREVYDAVSKRLARLNNNPDLVNDFLHEAATAQVEFRDQISLMFTNHVDESGRNQLRRVLSLLSTRAGALLLTGHATPIDCLPVKDREQILLQWSGSRIPPLRVLARSLSTLVIVFWLRTSPTVAPALGFPRLPVDAVPTAASGYPFRFLQLPPMSSTEPELIETDVVVVGSGCGGAVVAKTLAENGLKVLVVDKGYYWPPEYLPMTEAAASINLFTNGGGYMSEDASTTVVAGSTWGGGGTVNWSASLQPQGMVRREWAHKFGLTHFLGADFQADLDAVCDRMGVSTAALQPNKANKVLLEGARKLGWSAKPVPQNTGGEAHNDGYCTRGCRDCGKKGPTVTFLPDAAEQGAQFMEGFEVSQILFDQANYGKEKTAIGVRGVWTSRDSMGGVSGTDRTTREVIIRARKTIVSGGSIYSPCLLQRSGLKNRHIGRHLHLHPVSILAASWDEDVRPWEGPILTSVVNEFENLDGDGYGVKLEATTMMPSSFLPLFQWQGGLALKESTLDLRRTTGYIALARDRTGGRVSIDPNDPTSTCTIQYTPSPTDRAHILEGIVRLAEIAYVAGARAIRASIPGVPAFERPAPQPDAQIGVCANAAPAVTDALFAAWLARVRRRGLPQPDTPFASAHQMGSCRMGTGAGNSVVDARGRVWGTRGLYVADASVFPSASGVNPMITVMGIARGIARGIVDEERPGGALVKARM